MWWKAYWDIPFFYFLLQHLLYWWGSKMFQLWKIKIPRLKACVKSGLLSMVNLLCNHDHTMTAMNLKLKFKLKPLKKKLHFSSMLIAFTSGFEKDSLKSGAQTLLNPWSSADHAVISVPDSRCPVPTSLFPVLHSPFFVLLFHSPFTVPRSKWVPCSSFFDFRHPFSVPCWSNIPLQLWCNSSQFKQQFPKTS